MGRRMPPVGGRDSRVRMQLFRVVGATFLVIGVLIVVAVGVVPMLRVFGGSGVGGLGAMLVLPSILFTLVPIGVVFLVIANVLKGIAGPTPGGIPGAVEATATVRSTSQTAIRVNGQPVLRIDLDLTIVGLPTVPVSVRRTVPREHLGVVAPGAVLPAMADPANPRRFAIDWARVGLPSDPMEPAILGAVDLGGVAPGDTRLDPAVPGPPEPVPPSQLLGTAPVIGVGVAAPVVGGDATVDVTGAALSALRAAGEPGRGVIRGATDMAIGIGDGRLYRLQLDVIPDGRPGFAAEHVTLVPAASLWRMVTGVTLPLFLDRTEPTRLAIDWST